jgi:serine/threonine protein kinase
MLGEDARPVELFDTGLARLASAILHPPVEKQKFHPYHLVKLLGEGGMGVVYLARHEHDGSHAALKVLRDAWISPARRERFVLEQEALAALTHPNIARLYEAHAPEEETPWFAMEYVDGHSLTRHCRKYSLDTPARLRLFRSLCEAVQYAHEHHLIHRDLKPSNVLVSAAGVVKLLDFGIAQHLDSGTTAASGHQRMTRSHAAPEQLRGEPTGVFTDIYALGVILYELLTDRLPFDPTRRTPEETAPAPLVPASGLAELCLKAMRLEASERHGSASLLIQELDHHLAGMRGRAAAGGESTI